MRILGATNKSLRSPIDPRGSRSFFFKNTFSGHFSAHVSLLYRHI